MVHLCKADYASGVVIKGVTRRRVTSAGTPTRPLVATPHSCSDRLPVAITMPHVLLVLLALTPALTQTTVEVFRTELFPEQLEQQQIQFQQISLQQQLQNLQRLLQVATSAGERQQLQRQQDDINGQMRQMQRRLLMLQQKIQERLGGGVAFVTLPDVEVDERIVNRLDNPPVPPQPQQQPFQPPPRPTTQFQPPTQPPRPQPQQFPPPQQSQPSDEATIPCSTLSGEAGHCRPLIKCLSFYAELPELKKQPCQLGEGGLGVCCPLRSRPTGKRLTVC
jgi:hypothetical protein